MTEISKHFQTPKYSSSSVRMKTRAGTIDSLITNEVIFGGHKETGKSRLSFVPKGQIHG